MKIELLLTNPLLVDHCAPIMLALRQRGIDAAFVCVPPASSRLAVDAKQRLHASCIAAAQSAGLPYRTHIDASADIAITALGANQLHLYEGIKLKIRYGVSLHRAAIHHNRAMTRGFDGLLAHGEFERDLFARWFAADRIKLMGIPRHDAYFQHPVGKNEARSRLALDATSARTLIAYFPTWSIQSSLRSHLPGLIELARSHATLLVKPHALSLIDPEERKALDALAAAGARVLGSSESLVDALVASDIVIADATSGATPEVVLLSPSTPTVLLTARKLDELFSEISLVGPIVSDPSKLAYTVASTLQHDEHRGLRIELRQRLFSDYAGHAAERAVDCILELACMPKISAAPGFLERTFPHPFRVVRGQRALLGCRLAAMPPRNVAAR